MDVFIDMDDVVYDLSDHVRTHVNKDFNRNYEKGFNKTYWYYDYEGIPQSYFRNLLQQKGIFFDGELIPGSVEYIKKIIDIGHNVYFLTAPQYNCFCSSEKIEFVKKNFPFIPLDNIILTPHKHFLAKKGRILVDDNPSNLIAWKENKGTSIGFGTNGWTQEYKGIIGKDWREVYNLIKAFSINISI